MDEIKIGDVIHDSRSGQQAVILHTFPYGPKRVLPHFLVAYDMDKKPRHADDQWVYDETCLMPDLAICYHRVTTLSIEEMLLFPNRYARELGQKLYVEQQRKQRWRNWWTKLWRRKQ